MHRERIFWRGAAILALVCALAIPAVGQERLKDPAADRPKDPGPDSAQQRGPGGPQKRPEPAKRSETFDHLKFFGDVIAGLERSYVVKPDSRKLTEAAIRGMRKELNAPSFDQAQQRPDPANSSETSDHLQVFREAVAELEKSSAVKLDYRKLVEAAIHAMLKELDARSEYMDPQAFGELWRGPIGGGTAGIGVEMRLEGGRVQVVAALTGTPAERGRLEPGDVITHVDGRDLIGLTLDESRGLLRGAPGSTLVLKILPEAGGQPREVELRREVIRRRPVLSSAEQDVGYVRISEFLEDTDKQLTRAVQDLRREIGSKLKGFVIDLRNNKGGLLNEAVGATDVFLDHGLIAELRGREEPDRRNAKPGDAAGGVPLVVLVNGATTTGAEIMAAALQDHKRARLVGSRTLGMGTIQTIIPLGTFSYRGGALKLTTAHSYTPLGRALEGVGVEPDIVVERTAGDGPPGLLPLDKSRDAQLQRALSLLRDGT